MLRLFRLSSFTVFFLSCITTLAFAQSPHFVTATETLQTDGDLALKFKEAGLGNTALTTSYVASANASATCTCVSKSGNCPNAANKVTFSSEVSQDGTFSVKNGSVSATLVIEIPACPSSASPTCGGGQKLVLSEISYTDISLTDTTNNVSANVPTTQGPVTFFTCS
jgi:hypothetical protein